MLKRKEDVKAEGVAKQNDHSHALAGSVVAKERALYADDMAAGANTLEELFEIYQALVIALDKAGIQVKASKVEFGVEEVTLFPQLQSNRRRWADG